MFALLTWQTQKLNLQLLGRVRRCRMESQCYGTSTVPCSVSATLSESVPVISP